MKKNKPRMTTSKRLTWIVTIVWVISVFVSFIAVFFHMDTAFILATVSGSFTIILSGYFTKAFFETKEIERNKLISNELENETINEEV